jgi:thiol-disulfide isomerase/thioredoxin
MKKTLLATLFFALILTGRSQTLLDTATNFTVKDVSGNTWELYSILDDNKIVVIDFFSTACGTCQLYAPDIQAAYEAFGENEGNVFFIGIDKGNTNDNVQYFDSVFGITYPDVSGQNGGGNPVHMAYSIQGTPTLCVILPNRYIPVKQIYPPSYENLVDSITSVGGTLITSVTEKALNENFLVLSPNPAISFVNLNINLEQDRTLQVEIYNLLGEKVLETNPEFYEQGRVIKKINLPFLPKGPYFVRLLDGNTQLQIKKLILR